MNAKRGGMKPHSGRGRGKKVARNAPSGAVRRHGVSSSAPSDKVFFGALDLGTNNCRLLIASALPRAGERERANDFLVQDAFSRIVRLGEGLSRTGSLSETAMKRTIDALRICSNKLIWHKVTNRRLIATEACRMADNGHDFIARVKEETGLELEIIDRETEAHLAAAGAGPLIDKSAQSALIFDIGGGSTEILWVEQGGGGQEVLAWTSLPEGVVTLSEKFGGGREVTRESFMAMRNHINPLLAEFAAKVKALKGEDCVPSHLLGTSGTVTTVAGVHLKLRRYDRSRVDGCWLKTSDVSQIIAGLLNMSYGERTQNACIGKERADLVMAGCAILEEITLAFPAPRIRVADRGLREGILTQLMRDHQCVNKIEDET